MRRTHDVLIVGAGPAGCAAALQLLALRPGRGDRIALVDGAVFPRPKLCGGGITPRTEELLASLGVEVAVPSVDVEEMRFLLPERTILERGPRLFRVVRRERFDAALVDEASRRGAELRCGFPVQRLEATPAGIAVRLASGEMLEASVVVGADGANSVVRRDLVPAGAQAEPFVALEILTPGHGADPARATFDFRPGTQGVRGYAWDFPSIIDGEPFMNRGIASIGPTPGIVLKDVFRSVLRDRRLCLDDHPLQGAWAPVYDPRREQSAPRVLLAGDAVGIDPWLGEGISSAIGTGIIAGHFAARALEDGDVGFADYGQRIASSTVGQHLLRNARLAAGFYGEVTASRSQLPASAAIA